MHPRMQELLEFMDRQYATFRAAADGVPAAQRSRQPAEGCWSVVQVVDHVARVEGMFAGFAARALADARAQGLGAETETSTVLAPALLTRLADRATRRNAPPAVHPAPNPLYDEALAALDDAHSRARELLAGADGLALETVRMPHPSLGMLNLYEWGVAVGGHEGRHTEQVREIAETLAGAAGGSAERV